MSRTLGRTIDKRTIATTLLAKGLEFDHAVILDASQIADAENMYVAMTRGAKSLTILTKDREIRFPKPAYVA